MLENWGVARDARDGLGMLLVLFVLCWGNLDCDCWTLVMIYVHKLALQGLYILEIL